MAHLWMESPSDSSRGPEPGGQDDLKTRLGPNSWSRIDLRSDALPLDCGSDARASIIPFRDPEGVGGWAILTSAPGETFVNGMPLLLGLRVLADRDEIRFRNSPRMAYSAEEPAQIQPLSESKAPGVCARCRQSIEAESPAVQCPGCSALYHETQEFPCFTYAETCTVCSRAARLGAFLWRPWES
jgi:hypothetical protein